MKQLAYHIQHLPKKVPLVAVLLLFCVAAQAQKPIRTNLRADVSIPVITSNYMLRKAFSEIFDVNMSYHFSIGKNVTVGPAVSWTHFTIDSLTYSKYRTRMHIVTPAVDIGYQAYMGENSLFTGSVQVGYASALFKNVMPNDTLTPRASANFSGLSFEPMLRFYFFTGDRLALGIKLSYKVVMGHSDYRNLYLDKFNTFDAKQNSGTTQYFNGGVVVLIGASKKNVKQ